VKSTAPRLKSPDSTLSLLAEGYEFIRRRTRHFHSDVFVGRLLGESTIFFYGKEAASIFYDTERFRRADALPNHVRSTLFGNGGVQTLDDDAHRMRKHMFMSLMERSQLERFLIILQGEWEIAAKRFCAAESVHLFSEAQAILCRAVCAWSGVDATPEQLTRLSHDCAAMVGGFGSVGPRFWTARLARQRSEAWARSLIARAREQPITVQAGSVLDVIARHRQLDGDLLPIEIAAVELLNVIRPTTALAYWITFMVLALRDQPRYRRALATDDGLVEVFVHEVRRFYPFTPFVAARARSRFFWQGVEFEEGALAVLDIYGTLRDQRLWENPDEFIPERLVGRIPSAYDLIPQGGGDPMLGHRCAGEWLSIEALKLSLRFLTRFITYDLPAQDLSYRVSHIPTAPKSGVILQNVELVSPPSIQIVDLDGAQAVIRTLSH